MRRSGLRSTLLLLAALSGPALAAPAPSPAAHPPAPVPTAPAPRLALGPTRAYGGRVWFRDELEPVADAVAEALARPTNGGYRVIPNQELRAFWDDVRAGRLPGVAGVCPTPPPPGLLALLAYPDALNADHHVRCDARACRLEVEVRRAGRGGAEVARFAAELPVDGTPASWAELIRRDGLVAIAASQRPAGGLATHGGRDARPGIHVALGLLQLSGTWAYVLDGERLAPLAARLAACEPPGTVRRDPWMQAFLIEVGEDGRLDRCEAEHRDRLQPPGFECRCDVLRDADFGRGAPGRRARFHLELTGQGVRRPPAAGGGNHAWLRDVGADDPSANLGWNQVSEAELDACVASVSGHHRIPVRLTVGRDGRVTAVTAAWPATLPAEVSSCLEAALHRGRFDCPLSGHATVATTVEITEQPY